MSKYIASESMETFGLPRLSFNHVITRVNMYESYMEYLIGELSYAKET